MNPVVRLSSFLLVVGLLAPEATAQPAGEPSPAEMVKRADTDGNGRLSLAEFVKARTAMMRFMPAKSIQTPPRTACRCPSSEVPVPKAMTGVWCA